MLTEAPDNEDVYHKEVAPLMDLIHDICMAHGMPFMASIQFAPDAISTTGIIPDYSHATIKALRDLTTLFIDSGECVSGERGGLPDGYPFREAP